MSMKKSGEFMFGVSPYQPTRSEAERMEAIATEHGATFIEADLPGQGYHCWFTCPNIGAAEDELVCRAVLQEVHAYDRPPRKEGQLWEPCQCGREPVNMPLNLCDKCWPKGGSKWEEK
jgi:hypothetical protein